MRHLLKQYNYRPSNMIFSECKNLFSKNECDQLIFESTNEKLKDGKVFSGFENKVRSVKTYQMPIKNKFVTKLFQYGMIANESNWQFDVSGLSEAHFLNYSSNENGQYLPHIDTNFNINNSFSRKITAILFLKNGSEFEGGQFFIQSSHLKEIISQEAGSAIFFPSFLLHGVEPMISGIRSSIVTWLEGPNFK